MSTFLPPRRATLLAFRCFLLQVIVYFLESSYSAREGTRSMAFISGVGQL